MTKAMIERSQRLSRDWNDEGDGYFSLVGTSPSLLVAFPLAYVALPEGHPDIGKNYGSLDGWPEVNGGLTFAEGNVFGWDYGHAFNEYDITGDISRCLDFFRSRA